MVTGDWTGWQLLAVVQHELLLFAGVFFLLGALDDLAVDAVWLWLKARGKAETLRVDRESLRTRPLGAPVAVFIPAWDEARVLASTLSHMLRAWPHDTLTVFVGVYPNDPATLAAARVGAGDDPRVRITVLPVPGPTTKADCLNALYLSLKEDERASGRRFAAIAFQDAEDMVDRGALGLIDREIAAGADFVQLPVEPVPQSGRRWLGSHYCEEFVEAHGKAMVVRGALGAALPAAGVGCATGCDILEALCRQRDEPVPFEPQSLTEDYELGLAVGALGGTGRFVRAKGEDGRLIATRAYFPSSLAAIVRQKTRWIHGIALQGWDRTGWSAGPAETWMRLRDRRGPLVALVFLAGYVLLALTLLSWGASAVGLVEPTPLSPFLAAILMANLAFFAWRVAWRFAFTARVYGIAEGLRAVLRIPVANVIAIMAGWRALAAYVRTLAGRAIEWDKTAHDRHPANATERRPEAKEVGT
ncbi:glycosyl transferase family protein [Erythrobacter sp.]|uniref:glycosyl transferase family protein n=1 Tax=Erythrobacter sp. TaxID=1042 RepID=UPI003C70D043